MKKFLFLSMIISLIIVSCTQNRVVPEIKIENTLKSVNFLYDSVGIDPHRVFLSLDRANKAIDSIGYPDAGYKVWVVQSDTNKAYRFMVEGYWPNQAIYDTIHNHRLFKNLNATPNKADDELWKALKSISYIRFTLVK